MTDGTASERESAPVAREAANAFGLLRLAFASMVILSHVPEQIDGDRSRELLTRAFGTLSFGGLAVLSFFIISGNLITRSVISSKSTVAYFEKRLLRIFPGFCVAYMLCILLVAPLGGADLASFSLHNWLSIVYHMLRLDVPKVPMLVLAGTPYPALNNAMWTVGYEFQCYVLAAVAGTVGLYRRRRVYLAATVGLLAVDVAITAGVLNLPGDRIPPFGSLPTLLRFLAFFATGACFHLFA